MSLVRVMVSVPHILVFDSGLGGLSVARAITAQARSRGRGLALSYAADPAGFPYGERPEKALRARILALMDTLIACLRPDVVVIACNTATVIALSALRARFDVPFVGTVPAIKPAANLTESGVIGVLATPSTVRREYTERLIHTFAYHCHVTLHGAPDLARLAEARLSGRPIPPEAIRAQIVPVFHTLPDGRRTDTLVLGCTHYPLLKDEIAAAAPWPVTLVDPSAAIARRALEVAENCECTGDVPPAGAFLTGDTDGPLSTVLRHEGFARVAPLPHFTDHLSHMPQGRVLHRVGGGG